MTCNFYVVCFARLWLVLLQSNCGRQAEMVQSLLNTPSVVSIGVIWHSETPAYKFLCKFVQRIGPRLHLNDVSLSLPCEVICCGEGGLEPWDAGKKCVHMDTVICKNTNTFLLIVCQKLTDFWYHLASSLQKKGFRYRSRKNFTSQ